MKADKYLESIGLGNVIDEEFFNDDDKSWYKVQELMDGYHQAKLDLLNIPVVSGSFIADAERKCNECINDYKTICRLDENFEKYYEKGWVDAINWVARTYR